MHTQLHMRAHIHMPIASSNKKDTKHTIKGSRAEMMSDSEKDTNTQSHTRTCKCAAKTNNGARAAVPRDASYVWRDLTCL